MREFADQNGWHALVRVSMLAFWLACSFVVRASVAEEVDYTRDVKPLLRNKCYACHGPVTQEVGLRVDAGKLLLAGGDDGPVIVAGQSGESRLLDRITATDADERMPPTGASLSPREIATLRAWIDAGAKIPADEPVTLSAAEHWSLQPIERPALPVVKDAAWPRNAIDRFVLAKLEARGWRPNPSASKSALVRRTYLDLIGLPPTPDEQTEYLESTAADAYEKLVRKLLASEAYGERYARHWLDVVRYADSNGYERDAAKPEAWRYRDYVIASLNADKPFDRFVVEQIAGDELDDASTETIIATGFHRLGPWDDEPADPAADRYDQLDDIVSTTSQAFLGLTMGCARCHDHKFDPLLQRDYYSLVAVFNNLTRPQNGRTELTLPAAPPAIAAALAERDARIAPLQQQIEVLRAKPPADVDAQIAALQTQIDKLRLETPDVVSGYFLREKSPQAPATHVLLRGSPHNLGAEVGPAAPAILAKGSWELLPPSDRTSRRRLSLAQWLVDERNPLTARVIVNRAWQWHFGEGLVRTPNDFGLIGERPTHPELLDYLAWWFVHEADWSLKRLHELIVTSRTYQMSRASREDYAAADPENRLLWRRSYQRLEVEAIRDSMLAVSGQLDRTMFGPPIYPHISPDALETHADKASIWPTFDERASSRRTVYAFTKRSLLVPMLEVLDLCDTTRSSPKRNVTTVPTQALTLFNGDFVNRQAVHLAARVKAEAGDDRDAQIDLVWRLAFCREPTAKEQSAILLFIDDEVDELRKLRADSKDGELQSSALAQMCRVVLNLNEFVYPD